VSAAARYAAAAALIFAVLIGATAVSLVITGRELGQSQRNWCSALQVLTATPVPYPAAPAANPSRVQAYRLYEDFTLIERQFGC
jgi:hypothetical protein